MLTPDNTRYAFEEGLDELELLADTAGASVVGRITQSLPRLHSSTYMGTGKVDELKEMIERHEADSVIFDDDLTPAQVRRLEKDLEVKLVDRSGIILDIFATRAKTAAAKAQVELAQLDYLRSRLTRLWTHLSRQKGGIGMRGPGETQIETDRRLIGLRIATLKEQLDKIDQQRTTQRKGRSEQIRVALVGYTNAGKSTLMNSISDAQVLAEDRLFATLDATTRQVEVAPNKYVLLSDTVGFIRKLPHRLIESFKSTLDETRESDVLLHVVDASHPYYEDHIRVVNTTLKEIGADGKPTLMVFNKMDVLEERGLIPQLRATYPDAAFVSALRGIGLDRLKEKLVGVMEADYSERLVYLPATEGKAYAHIYRVAEMLDEDMVYVHDEDGNTLPAFRLHYRASPKNTPELDRMLRPYRELTPTEAGGDGAEPSLADPLPADPSLTDSPLQSEETPDVAAGD